MRDGADGPGYTGSAGWMVRAGLEHILGFQKNADTVVIDPCIPKKWREYSIQYRYMDTTYDITVSNPDGVCRGVRGITVDGLAAEGNRFALVSDGAIHNVQGNDGTKRCSREFLIEDAQGKEKHPMPNMLDYLKANGNLGLDTLPLNDVDKLILAQMIYSDFGPAFASPEQPVSLKEALPTLGMVTGEARSP